MGRGGGGGGRNLKMEGSLSLIVLASGRFLQTGPIPLASFHSKICEVFSSILSFCYFDVEK